MRTFTESDILPLVDCILSIWENNDSECDQEWLLDRELWEAAVVRIAKLGLSSRETPK